jgi:hypothetical protein
VIEKMQISGVIFKRFKTKKKELLVKAVTDSGHIITMMAPETACRVPELADIPFPTVVDLILAGADEVYSDYGDKVYKCSSMLGQIAPGLKKCA